MGFTRRGRELSGEIANVKRQAEVLIEGSRRRGIELVVLEALRRLCTVVYLS